MTMQETQFSEQRGINEYLLHGDTVDPEVEKAMFEDPWYGLNNYENYGHWNNLIYTEDKDLKQKQLAWIWELRSYFGLSFSQVQSI